MEQVFRQIASFVILAVLWFYIGYNNGYDKGQEHEQQEMRKRIEIVDSIHKQDKAMAVHDAEGGVATKE